MDQMVRPRPALTKKPLVSDEPTDPTIQRKGLTALVALVAVAVAITMFVVGVALFGPADTREIVIPAGTGERVDAGEVVDAVPSTIEMSVGDTLVLVNEDNRPHVVGPWTVLPGTEFSYTFAEIGSFSGACSAHPDNTVRIVAT